MATMRQTGNSYDYTPDAAVSGGDVVVVGDRALVATRDMEADVLGALATHGVFAFTREASSGADLDFGSAVYWDATEEEPTSDADTGSNAKLGAAFDTLEAADTTWYIELGA